ncbi:MAG: hypothetical protein CMJ18_24595 [Phycisphaeraceae bacterium]|nr:hypothetical protein [Phycisphaeraceae bacterium]
MIVAALSCAATGSGAAASEQVYYRTFIVSPAINNLAIRPGVPLPQTCRRGDLLQVTACRGEFEPASFVVETRRTLESVHVDAELLRGSAGIIPADAIDIRVVLPTFKRINDYPGTLNWLLMHDPGLLILKEEPWPESLQENASDHARHYTKTHHFTREPIDTSELQPADVKRRQQFWITVRVPEDAAAGFYTSTLTITAANAAPRKIILHLTVPSFDLAPPPFDYSVYHPAYLEGGPMAVDNRHGYAVLSERRYLAELRNMVEHGCLNPILRAGPGPEREDGQIDMSYAERILALRRQVGMPDKSIYFIGNGPFITGAVPEIDENNGARNTRLARQLARWAKQRGYEEVYLQAEDEASGDRLNRQRRAWETINQGGARVFVATGRDFNERVGDVLNLPILIHPMHLALDMINRIPSERFFAMSPEVRDAIDLNRFLQPDYQQMVADVHRRGYRIFTYMDPMAGYTFPETHRRMRGLGLWKSGLDGTANWAFTHETGNNFVNPGPARWYGLFDWVLRGKEGIFDTLSWEAYREGYDDARYLATLRQTLDQAEKSGKQPDLARDTRAWLTNLSIDADLDVWRHEMIQRTEQLLAQLRR